MRRSQRHRHRRIAQAHRIAAAAIVAAATTVAPTAAVSDEQPEARPTHATEYSAAAAKPSERETADGPIEPGLLLLGVVAAVVAFRNRSQWPRRQPSDASTTAAQDAWASPPTVIVPSAAASHRPAALQTLDWAVPSFDRRSDHGGQVREPKNVSPADFAPLESASRAVSPAFRADPRPQKRRQTPDRIALRHDNRQDEQAQREQRQRRGFDGERTVIVALERFRAESRSGHTLDLQHGVEINYGRGARRRTGDVDHVLCVTPHAGDGRTPFLITIETKAATPDPAHLKQAAHGATVVSRGTYGGLPQHRIVVHPRSDEDVTYSGEHQVARMGLPRLTAYLSALLDNDPALRDRLASK